MCECEFVNLRVCGCEGVSHHVSDRDHPQDKDDDAGHLRKVQFLTLASQKPRDHANVTTPCAPIEIVIQIRSAPHLFDRFQ